MGVKLHLSTGQQIYDAGDVVEGAVRVDVTTNKAEGSSADALELRLLGRATTRVVRDNGQDEGRSVYHTKKDFLSFEFQLTSFGGKAAAGSHNFPFSLTLPPGLPSSMKENVQRGECAITYRLEARLHRPGILSLDATDKLELSVSSKPEEVAAAMPVLVGPETNRVKRCGCFNKGSLSLGFEADRSIAGVNEPVSIAVAARNDSSTSVKSMHVELLQVCTWYAEGYKQTKSRTVAALAVRGLELGDVQWPAVEGNQRGRSGVAVADEARVYIQDLLAAGTGTRYEILVPDRCLLTMKTGLIEVRHLLSVRLKTPGCVSSPDLCMPFRVQARMATTPGATPVGLQSVGGMVRGGSGEEVKVVSVPQSAVSMEFSNDVPQPSTPGKSQFSP